MSRILGACALVLLLLICLLATSPARLLGLVLPSGQVVMQGFSGTVWDGKASRCLVWTPAGYLNLGAVSWRLSPLSLALFAPRLTLESRWGEQTLDTGLVLRGGADVDLDAMEATLPADLLRQFIPVSLAGTLSLQLEQLKLRAGWPVAGAGRLVWQGGGWNSPSGPIALGSYALDFSQPPGSALVGEVVTLAGAVSAQGSVRLEDRAYDIDITLRGEGGLDERLQQALSLMARPVDGGYRIRLDGEVKD
ncbi:MAG: type II secretion system protein N [Halieaceae bacterium]|jgi:general secretion pathway protein N|nr:type II secretion system protein N [Halieaceae bacterium]